MGTIGAGDVEQQHSPLPIQAEAAPDPGVALSESNHFDLAAAQFRQLVATAGDRDFGGAAAYPLSTIALKRGDLSGAINLLEDAIDRQPEHPHALNNLANETRRDLKGKLCAATSPG